jgi:sugar O-acyltransferase (sialic acid O-acetyltransferase NeuD family)
VKKKLVIFGNGLMARMIHFYFQRDSEYEVVAFTVTHDHNLENTFCGLRVVDFEILETLFSPENYSIFVAIGPGKMNAIRERFFHSVKNKGYSLAKYVSPNAICASDVGENSFISDRAIIHPCVKFGHNTFCWDFTMIAHDSVVGSHCYLAPGSVVSTFSELGNNCILGTHAVINTRVRVAQKCLIGACSYIARDTHANGVYGEKNSAFYGPISEKASQLIL